MHFFGKIQNRIIAWDYTDSFLRKKQKIRKGINPCERKEKSKNGFSHLYSELLVLVLRPLTTWIFFESFPKETQKSWILRIRIRINPLNLHRARIHWIHNLFWDFAKEIKNQFLDSESGLGFFSKKCTLNVKFTLFIWVATEWIKYKLKLHHWLFFIIMPETLFHLNLFCPY